MEIHSQWLYYKTKIGCKALFFLLRMSVNTSEKMKKRQNLNHIVVSKTTLVCTAASNADAHLDQSVTKQATAMANSNRISKLFSTWNVLILVKKRRKYRLSPGPSSVAH